MERSLLNIFKTNTLALNKSEVKIQLIEHAILITLFSYIISRIVSSYFSLSFWALFSFFEAGIIMLIPSMFWDKFLNNPEMHSPDDYLELSFKGLNVLQFFMGLALLIGLTLFGYFIDNLIFGLVCAFSSFFPLCFIFIRRNIFTEDSQYLSKGEKVMGFNPKSYGFLGIIVAGILIAFGFFNLYFSYYDNLNIVLNIMFLLCSFVYICFILSPDMMNKVLSFEIRERSGFIVYSILVIILSAMIPFFYLIDKHLNFIL